MDKPSKRDLADLVKNEWEASYSDNGAIWKQAYDKLIVARELVTAEELHQAIELARSEWPTGS